MTSYDSNREILSDADYSSERIMIKIIDGTVRLEDVTEFDIVFLFGKYFS